LRRFARGLTGSTTEADDLVQAACERALSRAHQFQEGTRFDSWMFRIVQTIWRSVESRCAMRFAIDSHTPSTFPSWQLRARVPVPPLETMSWLSVIHR